PSGLPKVLWPGLAQEYPKASVQPSVKSLVRRLLHIQALEAARCFAERVVTTPAEADVGSILGIGFPAYTGGTLSYIDTMGVARFVAECGDLADLHGPRFRPDQALIERAERNEPFQPRLIDDAA